jgi:hypothetical protein
MTGAVHIELKVSTLLDHVLHRSHFVFIEQSHVQHALREYRDAGVMGVGKPRAGTGGVNRGLLCGQHQRSESSVTAMKESCFSNMVGEVTAKTDESSFGIAEAATIGTAETAKSLEIAVSSVLTLPFWLFCEIAAFTRSAQVIISPPF